MPTTTVLHWFDFVCPFCYLAQRRNDILRAAGIEVVELPFPIHPEIPPGGAAAPHRRGPMYDQLQREAAAAGLPLNWSDRLIYSRPALVLAEIVRATDPGRHAKFCGAVFDAYFGRGDDIEQPDVLQACLDDAGARSAWPATEPELTVGVAGLQDSVQRAWTAGVSATPAWLVDGELLQGLLPTAVFVDLADATSRR